ncbi:hypothetical protein ACHAXN_000944 [Cyclotella atomus]
MPANNPPKDKKLQAEAKEFVPSFMQPAASAWGAPSAAVKAAPTKPPPSVAHRLPQQQQQSQQIRPHQHQQQQRKRDGHGGRGSKPNSNGNQHNNDHRRPSAKQQPSGRNNKSESSDSSWSRGKVLPIELLTESSGNNNNGILRISASTLLSLRLAHLSPPPSWGTNNEEPECLWIDPDRTSAIEQQAEVPQTGGDVVFPSKNTNTKNNRTKDSKEYETAPPMEECKPIEVNEETRWKAKVFDSKSSESDKTAPDTNEEIVRRALLILNKLSLTKFDKLSDDFINCGIGSSVETLTSAVGLIVNKAQEEQHFSSMYAGLCLKLANTHFEGIDTPSSSSTAAGGGSGGGSTKKGKTFKKKLLERCQIEFESDTSIKIAEATKDLDQESEEYEMKVNLIKKHYLGHMRFIGELYKGDLISVKIMLSCLPQLLSVEENTGSEKDNNTSKQTLFDEEKIECFAKLMTVIGSSLERQSLAMQNVGKRDAAESLAECWKTVEVLAGKRTAEGGEGGAQVSNRIKFMLQDLLEMKQNGWVTRRQEESAKTLSQIHKEVAREERARRSLSTNTLRNAAKGNIRRGASSGDLDKKTAQVDKDGFVSVGSSSSKSVHRSASMTALQRSQSDGGWQKHSTARGGSSAVVKRAESKLENVSESKLHSSPEVCGEKAKCIVKEYFVGGDMDDAVLSIHELVGVGESGSVERGAKVIESAILVVLEMKQEEADKLLTVLLRCAKEKKLESSSFVRGLNDPLEFLSDIAVDAPLATAILIRIIAELVKEGIVKFDFLLSSPEYFRTDQNAARFGVKVLKAIGGDATSNLEYVDVIGKLMTEEDKTAHPSVQEFVDAAST